MKNYAVPDRSYRITLSDLAKEASELQYEIMKHWFFQHFEDPANRCPYNSREGGYQFLYGGPYDAESELFDEFGEFVEEDLIKELADELNYVCYYWSGIYKYELDDYYLYDAIGSVQKPYEQLVTSVDNLKAMMAISLPENQKQILLKMMFVNIITLLEAFLSEYFISRIETEPDSLKKFVESNLEFKNTKFLMSEVYKVKENIYKTVKEYLVEMIWHNIPKVNNLYIVAFNINFSEKIGCLMKAINKRHDLVHRAGKTKEGEEITLTKDEVFSFMDEVLDLANYIDEIDGRKDV